MFTYRTVDVIADTPLHKKLSLLQSGNQYEKGKQDLFAVVIAFRYISVSYTHLTLPTTSRV